MHEYTIKKVNALDCFLSVQQNRAKAMQSQAISTPGLAYIHAYRVRFSLVMRRCTCERESIPKRLSIQAVALSLSPSLSLTLTLGGFLIKKKKNEREEKGEKETTGISFQFGILPASNPEPPRPESES